MSDYTYAMSIKKIGKTIEPFEAVFLKNCGSHFNVHSLKGHEEVRVSKQDAYSYLSKSQYSYGLLVAAFLLETTEKVTKRRFFRLIEREVLKNRSFSFEGSPFTEKLLRRVVFPIYFLYSDHRDVFLLFQDKLLHILEMFQTICKHYTALDKEIEEKISDAEEIVRGYYRFAVEVVDRHSTNNIKKAYEGLLDEQGAFLKAFKENVERLNGIDGKKPT